MNLYNENIKRLFLVLAISLLVSTRAWGESIFYPYATKTPDIGSMIYGLYNTAVGVIPTPIGCAYGTVDQLKIDFDNVPSGTFSVSIHAPPYAEPFLTPGHTETDKITISDYVFNARSISFTVVSTGESLDDGTSYFIILDQNMTWTKPTNRYFVYWNTGLTPVHTPITSYANIANIYEGVYSGEVLIYVTPATSTPTITKTTYVTRTMTPTPSVTQTNSSTATRTSTRTPSFTVTKTGTITITRTPTYTKTVTETNTPIVTKTNTQTITQTHTFSPTFTPTDTITETWTVSETHTVSPTSTVTNTPTPIETIIIWYTSTDTDWHKTDLRLSWRQYPDTTDNPVTYTLYYDAINRATDYPHTVIVPNADDINPSVDTFTWDLQGVPFEDILSLTLTAIGGDLGVSEMSNNISFGPKASPTP